MMLEGKDKIASQVESKTNCLELNRPQDAHLVPSMSFKMTYLSDKISTEMNLVKNDSEYASNSPHKLGSYRRYTYDVISDEEFEAKDQEDDYEDKLDEAKLSSKVVFLIRPVPKNSTVQTLYTEEGDGSIFIETERHTGRKQLITVVDISTLYKEKRAKSINLAKTFACINHK